MTPKSPAPGNVEIGMWRQRELAFARQRGLCFYCYCEITLEPNKQNCFVLDHLNPSSRGGGDNTNNRVAACLVCDANKRSRTPLLVETAKQAGLLAPTPSADATTEARKWLTQHGHQEDTHFESEAASLDTLLASAEARGIERAVTLDTDTRVRFYEHDFYVLSNFSAFRLQWRGINFDTSEAAYHYEKFCWYQDPTLTRICDEIKNAPSAHEAFKIAERNRQLRRHDWDDAKTGIMRRILRAKVDQHEYVRRKLLATDDRELVEDSWRDGFWGWGRDRNGQNMLGKLWMEVRAEIRALVQP